MNKGRAGTSSTRARAMGQRPLTDEQRALVLQYRQIDAELERAETAVRELTDQGNKTMALLRRTGMQYLRIAEVLARPTRFRGRLEAGEALLGPPAPDRGESA